QVRDKSEEQQVILHVARLVEKKGTAILISALKRIIDKIGDYKLVIIGDGPLNIDLKKQVISLGLEKNVLFLGAQDHNTVMQWMRKATMFVLPSITASTGDAEGLGMVLLEAGATGIPIIGTNHGGIPEVIREGYNGFLIEERDVDSLAERILFLIENSTTRYDMGINARNYVSRYFNIEVQTQKLEQVYKELING
ncbi:TPA: glycosyltransferase, partial [Klebsiella quasipneumoniae subsp. similipneumoniae]|nr:glycosyltransferase [Klebsiella quasipneumoniae subsp. similipneumoniae]